MTDPAFHIETPRLYLSYFQPHNPAHCDWLVELYNTPEFIASIGGKPTSITSREAARYQLLTSFREEHSRNGYGKYLVSLKPTEDLTEYTADSSDKVQSHELVGMVSMMRGSGPNSYTVPDVGFVIHPSKMRRGYAKEATSALLDYAATSLGINKVVGFCDPENEASKASFRSLGFENRGMMELKAFGGKKGVVWVKPGMSQDLSVYGF